MDEQAIKRYAQLKVEEKRIKEELDELKPHVREEILQAGTPIDVTGVGRVSLREVKMWKFPDSVEALRADLKAAEAQSKATGTADYDVRVDVNFREAK